MYIIVTDDFWHKLTLFTTALNGHIHTKSLWQNKPTEIKKFFFNYPSLQSQEEEKLGFEYRPCILAFDFLILSSDFVSELIIRSNKRSQGDFYPKL